MSGRSAFRELTRAAERHAEQQVRNGGDESVERSHPIEELIKESGKQKITKEVMKEKKSLDAQDHVGSHSASEATTATHNGRGMEEEVEVIIEPVQSAWDARRNSKTTGERFYAPVVIAHNTQSGHFHEDDSPADSFADFQAASVPKSSKFLDWAVVRSFAKRPKMFGWVFGIIVASLVGGNIVSAMQTSRTNSEVVNSQQRSLEHALALLDTKSQPPNMKIPERSEQPTGKDDPALSAKSIDQYVALAMPQLSGTERAMTGPTPAPSSITQRPLPLVDTFPTPSASASSVVANTTLPKKPPIGDRMDEDDGRSLSNFEGSSHSKGQSKSKRSGSRQGKAGKSNANIDPLAGLAVRGYVVSDHVPFKVNAIQSERSGWRAKLVDSDDRPYVANGWVQTGTTLPNGWQVVDVQRNQIALLTPDGHVVTAPLNAITQ